jgi:hypothetical protein
VAQMTCSGLAASILVVTGLLLAGCGTVPMATPAEDQDAKQFRAPPPERVALYVIRPIALGAEPFNITVGQRTLGQLGPRTFLLTEMPAGRLDIRCHAAENVAAVVVDAAPSTTHYVAVKYRPGINCALGEVSEAEGREMVAGTTRAADIR